MHEMKTPENFTDNVMKEIARVERIRARKSRFLKNAGVITACSVSVCAAVYVVIYTGVLSTVVGFLWNGYQRIAGRIVDSALWVSDALGSVFEGMDVVPSYYVTPVFFLACAGLLMDSFFSRKNIRHRNP